MARPGLSWAMALCNDMLVKIAILPLERRHALLDSAVSTRWSVTYCRTLWHKYHYVLETVGFRADETFMKIIEAREQEPACLTTLDSFDKRVIYNGTCIAST